MSKFTSKLQGQTTIILGGTGGVGMSIASGLLSFGANVIITSSRPQRLETQLSVLRSEHPTATTTTLTGFVCDLASPDVEANLATLLSQVQTHLATTPTKTLNHFIYAAGDALPTVPLPSITTDQFHRALQVRATSALLAIKHFAPLLPASNRSSITLTSGSISEKPIPGGWALLAFIGSGLNGLTRQLASDLAPVRVNCVAPGVVDTELWSGMSEVERTGFYERMAKQLPTGEVGRADDVSEAYLYLMRDGNVTGTVVHSNGGGLL